MVTQQDVLDQREIRIAAITGSLSWGRTHECCGRRSERISL
jgi:hypothetical protein